MRYLRCARWRTAVCASSLSTAVCSRLTNAPSRQRVGVVFSFMRLLAGWRCFGHGSLDDVLIPFSTTLSPLSYRFACLPPWRQRTACYPKVPQCFRLRDGSLPRTQPPRTVRLLARRARTYKRARRCRARTITRAPSPRAGATRTTCCARLRALLAARITRACTHTLHAAQLHLPAGVVSFYLPTTHLDPHLPPPASP